MNQLRQTFRRLLRTPGFSITIVLMLALGIGATTAMFSWVHTVLLQPLPVPAPERLVNLTAPGLKAGSTSCGIAGDCQQVFSYPMFRDLGAAQDVFTSIAGHSFFRANLAHDAQTLASAGLLVSGSYFSVLGIRPAVGRLIGPSDEPRVGEAAVAVLAYDYWQDAFGGDRGVVGRTIVVNGSPLTIIGVGPAGFSGTTIGARPQIFVPLSMRWAMERRLCSSACFRRSRQRALTRASSSEGRRRRPRAGAAWGAFAARSPPPRSHCRCCCSRSPGSSRRAS